MRVLLSSLLLYSLFHFLPAIWVSPNLQWRVKIGSPQQEEPADVIWCSFFWVMANAHRRLVSYVDLGEFLICRTLMPAPSFPVAFSILILILPGVPVGQGLS